jgi:hypothetical protein
LGGFGFSAKTDTVAGMDTLLQFKERTQAQLVGALADRLDWLGMVARGVVTLEQASGYIDNAERVIRIKLDVLGYC